MATKDVPDELVCRHVHRYSLAIRAGELGNQFPYVTLAEETGQPVKVCYRAMERASARGLIDCGVSLRTGWLTDKGLALIGEPLRFTPPTT